MKMRAAAIAGAGLALTFAAIALAQQPASPPPSFATPNLTGNGVRSMAANCAPCHGTNGKPAPGSSGAALAGRKDIAGLMKAFQEGMREATVMQQIARGYGDAEIAALADHFSRQAR
jgi:cytochrome subunit of sulfide dehydrogenase